jgi:hypothetical protein
VIIVASPIVRVRPQAISAASLATGPADAFGGDPLRRPVLYLGQWTELSGGTGIGTLQPATLWLAAVPAFAALLVSKIGRAHEKAETTPELERAGA